MSNDEKNRRVSKAPAPIEPLSGGGTTRWQPLRPNSAPHGLVNDMDAGNRKPRWDKWRLMPDVKIHEAVALSLDIEPESLSYKNEPRFENQEFSMRIAVTIANSGKFNHSRHSVPLAKFASWALLIQWEIPEELVALAATNEKQAAQSQEQRNQNSERRWPWGSRETKLIKHLAAAADKFWKNFDPEDQSTAPTNKQVSDWLIKQGVAKRTAEVMATILRADDLPTGPRK